jgi:hypothetical protein
MNEKAADEFIEGVLLAHIREAGSLDLSSRAGQAALVRSDIERDRATLSELARARFHEMTINKVDYEELYEESNERLQRNERRLHVIEKRVSVDIKGDIDSWWSSASMEDRRTALRLFIERVDVAPIGKGNRAPASERLTIRWVDAPGDGSSPPT